MIEDIFYLDEGHIKITAASVGISSRRWTSIRSTEIKENNYKLRMQNCRFDILPIVADDGTTTEFFKTDEPNIYDNISRLRVSYNDVLPLDTPIREVIKGFALDKKTFYFLTFHSRITGLITLGDLNCRQVQVYIFGLICELERMLGEFIGDNLTKDRFEQYFTEKSSNIRLQEIWERYQNLVRINLENRIIEHLYLIDFFNLIKHFELFLDLKYERREWENLKSINELRNLVAHSNHSLLNESNDVDRLWGRIKQIEDLTFRLNQWGQHKISEYN